jgi:hypothetical protein
VRPRREVLVTVSLDPVRFTFELASIRPSRKADAGEAEEADAELSLLCSDRKAQALVKSLRGSKHIEHAAKDMLRAADLPLLPRDDPHVDDDLKRIQKAKPLAPVLVIRGDMANGLPLTVADGYHRICAVVYFDESAPVRCRIADLSA